MWTALKARRSFADRGHPDRHLTNLGPVLCAQELRDDTISAIHLLLIDPSSFPLIH